MRRPAAFGSFLALTTLLGLACGGAPPPDMHAEPTGNTRQADIVLVQADIALLQVVSSPPSLLPPELGSLISSAKDISAIYSGVTDGIKLLQLLGALPSDLSVRDSFNMLDADLQRIGAIIVDTVNADTRSSKLADALTAAADAKRAAANNETLLEFQWDDGVSQAAVQLGEMPTLFKRLYVDSTTDGGGTGWKYIIPDRPEHGDGTVYDWRLNVPYLMNTIQLRLQVMTAIDSNWRVDGHYDDILTEYRHNLKTQLDDMLAEVHCGMIKNFTDLGTQDAPNLVNDSESVACADINTGISVSQRVERGFADLNACTTFVGGETPTWTTDPACVDASNAFNATLQSTIDNTQQSLYRQVVQQMHIFDLRSLVDTLSFYLTKSPDLAASLQRIPVGQAPGLCLAVVGVNDLGSPLSLAPCDGSGLQSWAYDRRAGSIQNTESGKCLDVPAFNAMAGTPVQIWDCNGGANQKWTYDPVSRVLENALSTALDIKWDALGAGTPVWTWWRSEGPAQQWQADGPASN